MQGMLASLNIMSTEIRKKYELKARAASQRETRDRIAQAAAQLHEEKGVAQTTVAEIARRSGVSRLTVYNHFPDLESLLPACTAHFRSRHPFPELSRQLATKEPRRQASGVLEAVYAWYRETESLWSKVLSDRNSLPALDDFLSRGIDADLDAVAAELSGALRTRRKPEVKTIALARLGLDFWTWRSLTDSGLDDAEAAGVMADAITST